ncbi:MAG: hypothetical protein K2X81_23270, partial [Candidatus Obscuribacterales bacterium]|nr:hypothetical protein [Candidatus Obscuribacterales bacterium]
GELCFYVAADSLDISAASVNDSQSQIFSNLESLEAQIRQRELEPFKNNLSVLFDGDSTPNTFDECDFCGREDLSCQGVEIDSRRWTCCRLCCELSRLLNVELAVPEANSFFEFIPDDYFESSKTLILKSLPAQKLFCGATSASQNLTAALHFAFHSATKDFADRLDSASTDIKDLLKVEIDRVHASFMGSAEPSSLFVLEANNSDIVVLGSLPELLELSFGMSKLIDQKFPAVNYSSGLSYALNSIPLAWLIRESLQMSQKAQSAGPKFFAVNFAAEALNSSPCFSWATWRTEVKPLLEKIRYFEHLGALGFGFWDYLLDFSKSDSRAIYQLMYRLARREESHSALRQDASWTQFKSDILLSLAGASEQLIHKRNELKTALSWFLLFKRLSSHKGVQREFATIERK